MRTARDAPPCAKEAALVAVPTQLRVSLSERCLDLQRTGLASTHASVPAEAHREREAPQPRSGATQPQVQLLLSPKRTAHTHIPPCYAYVTGWPSPRMAAALRAKRTLCSVGRGWGAAGPMPASQPLSPTASGRQHRRRCAVALASMSRARQGGGPWCSALVPAPAHRLPQDLCAQRHASGGCWEYPAAERGGTTCGSTVFERAAAGISAPCPVDRGPPPPLSKRALPAPPAAQRPRPCPLRAQIRRPALLRTESPEGPGKHPPGHGA